MNFEDYWKLNSKRLHSENPWREELAREVWEAALTEFQKEFDANLQKDWAKSVLKTHLKYFKEG